MIKIKNVDKIYNYDKKILNNINLYVKQGEFVFITGKSGAGKSTLIKLLTKEEDITNGEITVLDNDIKNMKNKFVYKYRRNLGIVFQDFKLLKNKTVFENVEIATKVIGLPTNEARYKIIKILDEVGLSDKYKKYPDQLSGGECQKLAIARAIINNPKIILADECTANLDIGSSIEIIRLLKYINENYNITVLVATHDIKILELFKCREVLLEDGEIIKDIYRFF